MADTKISALATLAAASIAAGDLIPIVDISDTSMAASGTTKKVLASSIGATVLANTYTAGQTFAPSGTGTDAITASMPASTTAHGLNVQYNGSDAIQIDAKAASRIVSLLAYDNGASTAPSVAIGRNSNASTPSAGFVQMTSLSNVNLRVWPDAAGLLRILNAAPTNANDTSGTVVGAQSSCADAKEFAFGETPASEALRYVCQAASTAVKRFTYKSGAYNGEQFEGLVTDYMPRYGCDKDDAHPGGKNLNVITVIGDLVKSVAYLAGKIEKMEGTL